MTKRKANKPRKTVTDTIGIAKLAPMPKRAGEAPALMITQGEVLPAAPGTETRLPELPGQEVVSTLPPVPPPELKAKPALATHLEEPKLDVALPVEARAAVEVSVRATKGEATASLPARMNAHLVGSLGAIAGLEACQTLFMEMTRDNLGFAAGLAAMRSPLDIIDVATKFAGSQIGMYGRFSKTVIDIAAGRQLASPA